MADDLEQADGVAFLLAHLRGDEVVVESMLAMFGAMPLFAVVVGLLVRVLADAGVGDEALVRSLADWQERRRDSL